MSTTTKGMVFLEVGNKIVEGEMQERLINGKREGTLCELNFSDFDDVSFRFTAEGSTLTLYMQIPNYAQLQSCGADEELNATLGPLRCPAQAGFDVALTVDADKPPSSPEDVMTKFVQLRCIVAGVPLSRAFKELASKSADAAPSLPVMQYDWRRSESVFVVPQRDRVVVIFSLDFNDDTDQAMARVFLQEFVETQRSVNGAPPCSFSRTPPMELRPLNLGIKRPVPKRGAPNEVEEGIAGYISFAIFPSHVQTEEKRAKVISMFVGFRNYLHYHIKASKTYLHMRMRSRVTSLLQVLTRAMPEVEVEKKKMGGKAFKRAV